MDICLLIPIQNWLQKRLVALLMKMLKIIKITRLSELNINGIVQLLNDDYTVVVVIATTNSFMINECTQYMNKNQIEIMFKYKKENDRINYAATKAIVNLLFSKI